jgi:hypothetical protein
MTRVYGILGQSAPAATTLTTAYTVPSGRYATICIIVANRGTADTFRVAISPSGAAITNSHYIAYNEPISANESLASALINVRETDVIRVYSTAGALSFTVTGIKEEDE